MSETLPSPPRRAVAPATMTAAGTEVARLLAARAPFDALGPEELAGIVAETEIEFHAAGSRIIDESGGPVTFLRVIYSGAVELVSGERTADVLGAGDSFGHAAMLSGMPPGFSAVAVEDTLTYRIPEAVAAPLLDRARSRELSVGVRAMAHQAVARLIRAPVVRCSPGEEVGSVARRMTDAGATCAIVELRGGGLGILTDRDLRTRVVAAGRAGDSPVGELMTTPVYTVGAERIGAEVLFEMLERGIRHAPVLSTRGALIGVVEDADLFAAQPHAWFRARRAIERAATPEQLAAVARSLPAIAADLQSTQARPLEIARVLSALGDALAVRALTLSTSDAPHAQQATAWVALGSHARRELTAASTLRGALVAGEEPPPWVARCVDVLTACGLRSEIVTLGRAEADPLRADRLALLVERRVLWGLGTASLPGLGGRAGEQALAALARAAGTAQPPTGFRADHVIGRDGEHSAQLDIRGRVLEPIVALSRWAGARLALSDASTLERLAAAGRDGVLHEDEATALAEAFEFAFGLRMSHHAEQLAAGEHPDDTLDVRALGRLARDSLRSSFRVVSAVQHRLWP